MLSDMSLTANTWRGVFAVLVAVVLLVPLDGALAGGQPPAPAFVDAHGIHVVAVRRIDARQINVKVSSAALGRAVDVRVLLPAGYDPRSPRRFPVLYLFHGTSGRASDWVAMGDAERATAHYPLITVMPDAGFDGDGGGWFTNWVDRSTALGPSQWETFHVAQLIPWVDHNLRTIAARRGRAIAGLSQGGFGAMSYAARHPDTFVAAGSFSGAPEIDRDPPVTAGSTAVIEGTAFGLDGVEPEAMFGSRVTNEVNWAGHDPSTLMTNLRGMSLSLWTATGLPGPYDSTPNPGASGIELLTHESTQYFHDHLVAEGIPSYYDDYTYGTHSWPYWARDLREFLTRLTPTFAHPPAPARISYESIDPQWSQWGWSMAVSRNAALAFSGISDAGRDGLTVTGTGTATVATPAYYAPGSTVTVKVDGRPTAVQVHDRRIWFVVPLGSSETSVRVTITATPGRSHH